MIWSCTIGCSVFVAAAVFLPIRAEFVLPCCYTLLMSEQISMGNIQMLTSFLSTMLLDFTNGMFKLLGSMLINNMASD